MIKDIFCVTVAVQWLPGKCLGLQFVLIYFVATSHITSSTIPNCFSVDTLYCPCHRARYLQFFWEIYHKYLGFMEFAKYGEWGKFAASVGHPKAKRFSALGGGAMPSWPLTRGSAPGPRWRLRPQTSVIGSSSALAMCPPHIFWPGDALLIIKWCALHSIWQKCTDTHTQHLFRLTETLRIVIDF